MSNKENEKLLLKYFGIYAKKLRGKKSQFMLSCDSDLSQCVISTVERGLRDPQFTTVFKYAQGLKIHTWQLVKIVEENLPEGFSLIDL